MGKKNREPIRAKATASTAAIIAPEGGAPDNLIPATKIRKLCGGVSLVTFWRWRRSAKLGCPPLTEINGRLYGGENAWLAWRENQKRVHAIAA
jgi:hypothetical protein